MIDLEATGMSAKSRATQHRQWAVNAIIEAMQSTNSVDRETLFMIARKHLVQAQKAEHPPILHRPPKAARARKIATLH